MEGQDEYDSDLDDYDTDKADTDIFALKLFDDLDGGLHEYAEEREKHKQYPVDGNVKDRPWLLDSVETKEFFNYGLNEHQWKLLINKHILMLYEKHAIIRTHPHIQAAQNLVMKQMERGMAPPSMMYPGYPMMMPYPEQHHHQEEYDNRRRNYSQDSE